MWTQYWGCLFTLGIRNCNAHALLHGVMALCYQTQLDV